MLPHAPVFAFQGSNFGGTTHVQVWANYQGYVYNMINHYNPLTGRMYKDEPAILAWVGNM
jgi:hypothetical protein